MLAMQSIRQRSLKCVASFGYRVNENLPLYDEYTTISRSLQETKERIVATYVTGAVAYGFDREKALEWLSKYSNMHVLTETESSFLNEGTGSALSFKYQIEGLWALFWCCSLADNSEFSFKKECPNDLVHRLPNLKQCEDPCVVLDSAVLRNLDDIVDVADLGYCLHWSIRDHELRTNTPSSFPEYVVAERRRAIQWLMEDCEWEEISVDT